MRLKIDLRADAAAAWNNALHAKARGRFMRAMEGSDYEALHTSSLPTGYSFTMPFPWGDIDEGEIRHLLFASPYQDLLGIVAKDLKTDPEFNLGDIPFTVEDIDVLDTDVGGAGSTGVLHTMTGVVTRFDRDWLAEEYDITVDADGDEDVFWRERHSVGPFRDAMVDNLEWKHSLFADGETHPALVASDGGSVAAKSETDGTTGLPGPRATDGFLFDSWDLERTYALPVTVSSGGDKPVEQTYVVSKWRFPYTVRDAHHRRHLNLLQDVGMGERNSLGFGFINREHNEDGVPA